MALFRKLFFRKPPDGLVEICDRVYVFDCCFTTDAWEEEDYKVYVGGIRAQLQDHFPDASVLVFNFREGETHSQIANVLSEYDMTTMSYPRHYEGCPLLSMEVIHHFLRSSESWLSLGQQNVLLMHCERGGWPVLAFMLAALLIYRKDYTGEHKTLDMIYKHAPRELLHFLSPLNPIPSQLRYLQYVSRRNVALEWPPLDRGLMLDCVIMRMIPNFDGEGGCRPIFRIYGQDPSLIADRTPKVLFSTSKRSNTLRHYKQEECEIVKIDINCRIQGDVVLECISLNDDMEWEEMMFRVMFNTAFIRSNILMLSRDEIDILWDAKDQFPKDFRAEVLFTEMDAAASIVRVDSSCFEDKEGLPVEAFAKVQEIFSSVDWLITASNIIQEKLDTGSNQHKESSNSQLKLIPEKLLGKQSPTTPETPPKCFTLLDLQQSVSSSRLSPNADASEHKAKPQSVELRGESSLPPLPPSPSRPLFSVFATESIATPSLPSLPPHHLSTSKSTHYSLTVTRSHTPPPTPTPILKDQATGIGTYPIPPPPPPLPPSTRHLKESKVIRIGGSPPPPPLQPPLGLSTPHLNGKTANETVPPPPPSPPPTPQHHPLKKNTSTRFDLCPSQPPASPTCPLGENLSVRIKTPPPQPPPPPLRENLNVRIGTPPPPPPPPPPPLPPPSTSPLRENPNVRIGTPPPPPILPPLPSTSSLSKNPYGRIRTPPRPPPPPPSTSTLREKPNVRIGTPPPPPPPPPPSTSMLREKPNVRIGTPPLPPPPPPPTPLLKENSPLTSGLPPPNRYDRAARTAISSSVPPPPPSPASSSSSKYLTPASHNSSSVPSAPPPPPPAPIKAAVPSISLSAVAGEENSFSESPSPAPPFIPSSSNMERSKKLKPLYWLKLTRAAQGSLWAETQKSGDFSKAPEIDVSELESLFSAAVPNSGQAVSGGKSNSRASLVHKSETVQLIEHRRAYNCEIMLSKVKIPLHDLMISVLALEDSALEVDLVDNLIKFCPTKEEMELLKGYNGKKDKLGKCEQFFFELMQIPRTESKLRVFSFKIQFRSQVSDLRNSLNVVNSAAEQIRSSAKLKKVMQTILSLGNALNQGTARGSAIGFKLDSLLKLTETRARNNKLTLMHYLCKVLADKLPEVLDFSKDLASLEPASKIQLKFLAEEMRAISKGLEKVAQELSLSENDGPISENFRKALKEFLHFSEGEVRSLALLYSGVARNVDALILYFGEDPSRYPFEQVVSTVLNFVRMFSQAHNENCKQLELERKKAEKDAANEKLNTIASQKNSDNLIKSPIRSVK